MAILSLLGNMGFCIVTGALLAVDIWAENLSQIIWHQITLSLPGPY